MPNPLVSIIVPVYNVENYIHRAVDCLLNQTYSNLEIILVDDGSPDKCPQICDEYAKYDYRIKVIHKKNGGLSEARNVGLDIAKGEYITFMDSDDYISLDAIDLFLKCIEEQNVDVVCSGLNIVDNNGKIYDYRKGEISFMANSTEVVKLLLKDAFPYNFAPSKFFKRKLFDGVRFPVGRIYEDLATVYLAIHKAENIYCMKECLYYYERGRDGNITSELNTTKAAWSYYCGCLNSKEHISFCLQFSEYKDMFPILNHSLYIWSKLCIESSINLGKMDYKRYCKKIEDILSEIKTPISFKLKLILKFKIIYYYLYPILK